MASLAAEPRAALYNIAPCHYVDAAEEPGAWTDWHFPAAAASLAQYALGLSCSAVTKSQVGPSTTAVL